jgi:hypothetical protein
MTDADHLPESADFAAYLQALPKLLKNGDGGRVALICEGRVVSVWDTAADALQAGQDRFGPDAEFLTQPISPKDLDAATDGRPPARRTRRRPARP